MIERHYKTKELAELLAVHEDTIHRLVQKGEIPSVQVGSERRYPESGIQAYLERHASKPRTPHASVVPIAARRDDRGSRARRPS